MTPTAMTPGEFGEAMEKSETLKLGRKPRWIGAREQRIPHAGYRTRPKDAEPLSARFRYHDRLSI